MKGTLKHHPIVKDLPAMGSDDFESLKLDIADTFARTGKPFLHKIVLLEDDILDGRHRYQAAGELKIALKPADFETYDRKKHGEPLDWVMSQMQHRNRTPSIKTVEVAMLVDHWPASRGDGEKVTILAGRFKVSEVNVKRVREIRRQAPILFGKLARGEINVNAAYTRYRHHKQQKAVDTLKLESNVTIKDCDLRHGDNEELMSAMPGGSAQTIFADGPYNCGWKYRNDPTKDKVTDAEFCDRSLAWMTECARLLAQGGSLFVLIDDRYTDHYGMLLRETGLVRQPTIICWETFAVYNSAETGLSKNARYLHWYTKGDSPLINTVEARIDSWRKQNGDARAVDHGRLPPNVWDFVRVTSQDKQRCPWLGKPGEAPQLPRELPERAILLTSNPGDLVVDPFNGNGITGIAAITNSRRYLGIDRDRKGLEQSRSWIAHEVKRLKEGK